MSWCFDDLFLSDKRISDMATISFIWPDGRCETFTDGFLVPVRVSQRLILEYHMTDMALDIHGPVAMHVDVLIQ